MTARWQWFVPGRLEVFGKHTDYAGGRSLVAAVPRGISIIASATDDGWVSLDDVSTGQQAVIPVDTDAKELSAGWQRYVATVVRRLSRNFPGATLSTRIELTSNLPRAAGISSSSALVVAVAEALIMRAEIEQRPEWRDTIHTIEDRASYFGCIENGASFGALTGDAGVGTHGGSEDHAAILTSREGWLQQFSFAPLHRDRAVRMPEGWTFVVGCTGVRARKTGDARAAYNNAAALAAGVAEAWRVAHPGDIRPLGQLARDGADVASLSLTPELRARLDHFLAEDVRVVRAADAFERADVEEIGRLSEASQRDAERLLRNQVPETTSMAWLAREHGAAASCGFGAGWGGSVWALVKFAEARRFLDVWLGAYRQRHPHLSSEGFIAPPAAGLEIRS